MLVFLARKNLSKWLIKNLKHTDKFERGEVMKKKTLLLILLLMFISTNALSQNIIHGTITGDIQEGVSIIIWSLDCGLTVPVAELTTAQNGFWEYSGLENGRWLHQCRGTWL